MTFFPGPFLYSSLKPPLVNVSLTNFRLTILSLLVSWPLAVQSQSPSPPPPKIDAPSFHSVAAACVPGSGFWFFFFFFPVPGNFFTRSFPTVNLFLSLFGLSVRFFPCSFRSFFGPVAHGLGFLFLSFFLAFFSCVQGSVCSPLLKTEFSVSTSILLCWGVFFLRQAHLLPKTPRIPTLNFSLASLPGVGRLNTPVCWTSQTIPFLSPFPPSACDHMGLFEPHQGTSFPACFFFSCQTRFVLLSAPFEFFSRVILSLARRKNTLLICANPGFWAPPTLPFLKAWRPEFGFRNVRPPPQAPVWSSWFLTFFLCSFERFCPILFSFFDPAFFFGKRP